MDVRDKILRSVDKYNCRYNLIFRPSCGKYLPCRCSVERIGLTTYKSYDIFITQVKPLLRLSKDEFVTRIISILNG